MPNFIFIQTAAEFRAWMSDYAPEKKSQLWYVIHALISDLTMVVKKKAPGSLNDEFCVPVNPNKYTVHW